MCKAMGLPMQGLAESGWPGCNASGGDGGVICENAATGRPTPNLESSGWTGATAVLQINKHPILQISGEIDEAIA